MNFELSGVDSDTQDSISFDWGGGTALGNQRAEVYVHVQAADEPGCPWVQIPPRKRAVGSAPCCNGSISGCNSRLSSSLGKSE
jgi:hypothetical protein